MNRIRFAGLPLAADSKSLVPGKARKIPPAGAAISFWAKCWLRVAGLPSGG